MPTSPGQAAVGAPSRWSLADGGRELSVMGEALPSPKRRSDAHHDRWYPYYAGYSSAFAGRVIETFTQASQVVLDPWNGAGTTTLMAAMHGRRAMGLDINPAMATIARARLLPRMVEPSLLPLADEIVKSASRSTRQDGSPMPEPLCAWFKRPAANLLRAYERRITQLFENPGEPSPLGMPSTVLAAFFTMALFSTTRELLSDFRSSNPTWLKYPATPQNRINPSPERVSQTFRNAVTFFSTRLPKMPLANSGLAEIKTGDALNLDADQVFDACLGSPPYFTRVDYVRATLAELAVLGTTSGSVDSLRRATTGTPVVRGATSNPVQDASRTARSLEDAIAQHSSKGSANYYAPWASRYFRGLQASITGICKAVVPSGPIGIVIQDSYYKELHVDLQRIVVEMFSAGGRHLVDRVDFTPTHVRAWMHPAASTHRPASWTTTESLLVFN